jgi:hypothetical protein
MIRRLLLLIAVCTAVWLLALGPAWLLGGVEGLTESAIAALLCLVPAAATMLWCDLMLGGAPEQQLAAVMGGTVIRMFFVMAIGMVLYYTVAALHHNSFWLWIVVFYLATLALEVVLVVRRPTAVSPFEKHGAGSSQ